MSFVIEALLAIWALRLIAGALIWLGQRLEPRQW
jgi:hypothetical protein